LESLRIECSMHATLVMLFVVVFPAAPAFDRPPELITDVIPAKRSSTAELVKRESIMPCAVREQIRMDSRFSGNDGLFE
jgi:hypothetical protein